MIVVTGMRFRFFQCASLSVAPGVAWSDGLFDIEKGSLALIVLGIVVLIGIVLWRRHVTRKPPLLGKPDPSTRRDAFNDTKKYRR